MSFRQELTSWLWFYQTFPTASNPPVLGEKAPSSDQLKLPCDDGKPAIVSFLRHCGCPFAEKTFTGMRAAAVDHPDVHFIAISHSSESSTKKWLESVGGAGSVSMIVDSQQTLYAKWGLSATSFWHVLNPWAILDVIKLGRREGVWNRPTESGSRWQQSGTWTVDGEGLVRWGRPSKQANDIPNFEYAVAALEQRTY